MTRSSRPLLVVLVCLGALAAGPSRAGNLKLYEASVGQGQVRTIPGPVTNALIDLDYAPATAEGGKLFGMSEIDIETTGNLVLSPTGFLCQATWCLFSPWPFTAGKKIRVTGGNDLIGETASASNFMTIGVTGSVGYIVLVSGEYLDGTGTASSVGAVRTVGGVPLVTVPEVDPTVGLVAACGVLALASRQRRRAHAA